MEICPFPPVLLIFKFDKYDKDSTQIPFLSEERVHDVKNKQMPFGGFYFDRLHVPNGRPGKKQ